MTHHCRTHGAWVCADREPCVWPAEAICAVCQRRLVGVDYHRPALGSQAEAMDRETGFLVRALRIRDGLIRDLVTAVERVDADAARVCIQQAARLGLVPSGALGWGDSGEDALVEYDVDEDGLARLRFEGNRFEEIQEVRRIITERIPGSRERRVSFFVGEAETPRTYLQLVDRRWKDPRDGGS